MKKKKKKAKLIVTCCGVPYKIAQRIGYAFMPHGGIYVLDRDKLNAAISGASKENPVWKELRRAHSKIRRLEKELAK